MKAFHRLTLTAILAGSALLVTGCGGNSAAAGPAPSDVASPAASSSSSVEASVAPTLPAGFVAKGVAHDGKGEYLQMSIADTDPAMQYNPTITDAAAKAHYSKEELAEAHRVAVRFIAEEAIDSTLNGAGTDVDGWWASHKDQIHPLNQDIMLADMKSDEKDVLARERWIAARPGYSYVHGATTPRVISRTITPIQLTYVESANLKGIYVDTTASYEMAVDKEGAMNSIQASTAELSFAVAIDPADGKWKIAGYDTNYHTAEG